MLRGATQFTDALSGLPAGVCLQYVVAEGQCYMSWVSPAVPSFSLSLSPPSAPVLNRGLLHGNENCQPVPVVIMEFRGG